MIQRTSWCFGIMRLLASRRSSRQCSFHQRFTCSQGAFVQVRWYKSGCAFRQDRDTIWNRDFSLKASTVSQGRACYSQRENLRSREWPALSRSLRLHFQKRGSVSTDPREVRVMGVFQESHSPGKPSLVCFRSHSMAQNDEECRTNVTLILSSDEINMDWVGPLDWTGNCSLESHAHNASFSSHHQTLSISVLLFSDGKDTLPAFIGDGVWSWKVLTRNPADGKSREMTLTFTRLTQRFVAKNWNRQFSVMQNHRTWPIMIGWDQGIVENGPSCSRFSSHCIEMFRHIWSSFGMWPSNLCQIAIIVEISSLFFKFSAPELSALVQKLRIQTEHETKYTLVSFLCVALNGDLNKGQSIESSPREMGSSTFELEIWREKMLSIYLQSISNEFQLEWCVDSECWRTEQLPHFDPWMDHPIGGWHWRRSNMKCFISVALAAESKLKSFFLIVLAISPIFQGASTIARVGR